MVSTGSTAGQHFDYDVLVVGSGFGGGGDPRRRAPEG